MEKILDELKKELEGIKDNQKLAELKAKYLGKKGSISALSSKIKDMSVDEKKNFGITLNKIKNEATSLIDFKRKALEKAILDQKLKNESVDISLPSTKIELGAPSIVEKIIEEIEEMTKWPDNRINEKKEILAFEITKLVHGEEEAQKALQAARALFSGEYGEGY